MAFDTYKKTVRSMTSEYIEHEAYWPAFLNLSDEQLNVYYAEAIKSKSLIRARVLFAKDYGHPVRKPQKDEAFIKELTKVHCTWESLSAPAQQYYIDTAKNNLLECQKKKVFDVLYTDESHYEFKDEYGILWGALHPKCEYYSGITDEESAIKLYQVNRLKDLLKEPGMANKRQFQLAGIMHQRFMNLSDEERQPYFDIVNRVKEIRAYLNVCNVEGYKIYSKNFDTSRKWEDASAEEKAVCEEKKKQNMATLLQKYPDVAAYFHWVVNDHKNDKSRSDNTITFVQKESTVQNTPTARAQNTETAATEKPSVINKTTEQAFTQSGSSGTSEVVIDGTNIQKEKETTLVTGTESTTAIVSDAVSQEDDSLESHSVNATVTEDTSEMSKSEDTRETVKEAKVDQKELEFKTTGHATEKDESVTAKCENISENKPQTSATSANTKKTPTAFMFYKKAMRRLNADQNFGKKDNESQRQALISGWKKLSAEEKAIYFKMENRARAEAQLLQLL